MNIQSIVVAGAGTMGSSMAQIFAKYHDHVVIYNHREVTLQKAQRRIEENVQTLVQAGELTPAEAKHLLGALSYTTEWDCFSSCDLVVENLAEDLPIKQAFYEKFPRLSERIRLSQPIHRACLSTPWQNLYKGQIDLSVCTGSIRRI